MITEGLLSRLTRVRNMPWHTCEGGDRILLGAEARLFANAIAFMIDEYDLDSILDRSSEKNLNFGYKDDSNC